MNFRICKYYSFLIIVNHTIIFCDVFMHAVCRITKVKNNVFSSLGNQILCQMQSTVVVFYIKVLVNDILVRLER